MKRLFGAMVVASSIIGGAIGTAGGLLPDDGLVGDDLGGVGIEPVQLALLEPGLARGLALEG